MVILITGKKNSGKTTYAQRLKKEYEYMGILVYHIDGDEFRKEKGNYDFSDKGREKNLMDASHKAMILENQGYTVIMSFVMPLKKWRQSMRDKFIKSRLIYIPGGELWENSIYEIPDDEELDF